VRRQRCAQPPSAWLFFWESVGASVIDRRVHLALPPPVLLQIGRSAALGSLPNPEQGSRFSSFLKWTFQASSSDLKGCERRHLLPIKPSTYTATQTAAQESARRLVPPDLETCPRARRGQPITPGSNNGQPDPKPQASQRQLCVPIWHTLWPMAALRRLLQSASWQPHGYHWLTGIFRQTTIGAPESDVYLHCLWLRPDPHKAANRCHLALPLNPPHTPTTLHQGLNAGEPAHFTDPCAHVTTYNT